jgi:hypothetical protein
MAGAYAANQHLDFEMQCRFLATFAARYALND